MCLLNGNREREREKWDVRIYKCACMFVSCYVSVRQEREVKGQESDRGRECTYL